jgi:hypothetical protein
MGGLLSILVGLAGYWIPRIREIEVLMPDLEAVPETEEGVSSG